MTIMPPTAIIILIKSGLRITAFSMRLFGAWGLVARLGINIQRTEFLSAFPAPGSTTAGPNMKFPASFKAASKNIVTCGIF